jgi:hypothetical protein
MLAAKWLEKSTSQFISQTLKLVHFCEGVPHADLLAELQKLSGEDSSDGGHDPAKKRLFAYVYTSNDLNFDLQKKAYALFEGLLSVWPRST